MDLTKIKLNDVLEIKGKKYEIIWKQKSVSYAPEQGYRDIIEFNLLEEGSKRITPTHGMAYYFDTKEITFSSETEKSIRLKNSEIKVISSQL